MIVDGRQIAASVLAATKEQVALFDHVPVVRAITCAPSAATLSYLRIKAARAQDAGMRLEVVELPDTATEEAFEHAILAPGADAVIVQLPLPAHLDTNRIVNTIPLEQDADVLSQVAYEAFLHSESALMPPVVAAIETIFNAHYVDPMGVRAVVVGQGKLVGLPAKEWLTRMGAHVTTVTREHTNPDALKQADLIISGAGVPGLITPGQIQEGVVLIDAGTSESGGQITGDIDAACAQKAALYTPVPGGVGPVAVACLFRNVASLLERSLHHG